MKSAIIDLELCNNVLMVGVDYNNRPGGMSSVIKYYEHYFYKLNYVSTTFYTKKFSLFVTFLVFIMAIIRIIFVLLLDKNIKIVHIHTAANGSFIRASVVVRVSKFLKKKVILHCHASRFKEFYMQSEQKNKILDTLNSVDKFVVLSESWSSWFKKIGVIGEKIVVLNNFTDYPKLEERKVGEKLHLLYLGELGKRKGIFDILDAICNNQNEFRNLVEFRFGGNTHEEEVRLKITEYGIDDFVHFEGWISGQRKIDLFNWADVYILPSFNEGLPIGILEAMSYGCAIIATPVGGIPEVVKDGINGIIVEPGDNVGIAYAIKKLMSRELRVCMSKESKEIVKDYLPERVMNKLKTVYLDLLEC